ncbi:hypothetical protein GCM10010994_44530 [Chelatococcus reniformis]|uniref:Uncharacterized protein n=1 Tax=Chelatococcus reniformis TaxID=1494448 RepID=A0A916XKN6_9HYPH|nr:hypothetical protein GCM10010994_44530 [Chelatococcus reniformis]
MRALLAESNAQHGTCELDVFASKGKSVAKRWAGGEREAVNPEMMHPLALTRPNR